MSEFKDFSLPELYQTPVPQVPGQLNWKLVAIYGGIAVLGALILGLVINRGNMTVAQLYLKGADNLESRYLADTAGRDELFELRIARLEQQNQKASEKITSDHLQTSQL